MVNKLSQILENKRQEVSEKKGKRDFLGSIINPKIGDISIIAEIKLASPSEGRLGEDDTVLTQVEAYEKGGADAISLVADKKYFGGDLELIKQIKNAVSIPVFAKDFIIDPYQIYEAKTYGADAILLIAKILPQNKLIQFVELSFKIGLEPVVELQNKEELSDALYTDTRIIAVNARDLNTLEIDIDRACRFLKLIPQEFITLGFSGVFGRNEVEKYIKAGARGVLVGTSLMKSENIGEFIKELKGL